MILFLLFFIATGQAQVIELEEAKVTYDSPTMTEINSPKAYTMMIKENFSGQFINNPIKFMKEHFDVNHLLAQGKKDRINSYDVDFKSKKGILRARFNESGKLISTFQKFKNIPLPHSLAQDLYRDYKGWAVTEFKYVASGKADQIDKEVYKLKLMNGNKTQRIKIKPDPNVTVQIAGKLKYKDN